MTVSHMFSPLCQESPFSGWRGGTHRKLWDLLTASELARCPEDLRILPLRDQLLRSLMYFASSFSYILPRHTFVVGLQPEVKVRLGFSLGAGVTSRCSCKILFVNCLIAFPCPSPSDSQSGMSWHKAWGEENPGHRVRKLDFSCNSALSDAVLGLRFLSCKLLG